MKTTAKQAYEDGARYRGFILYAEAADGTFWVVGQEKWMSEEEIDALADEKAAR
jgi:hypothetical protein